MIRQAHLQETHRAEAQEGDQEVQEEVQEADQAGVQAVQEAREGHVFQ